MLVHLYEDEGPEFLEHLNGMFALAIWDAKRRQLLLARDRLGKKPLVYRHEPGRLLFASELKSLLEVPGVPREIDPQALDEYLTYQYVPHPRTIFRGIAKLPPGHYAVWRDGRLDVRPYWQPDFNVEDDRPAEEYADELRELLTSAVEMRLQSEVPLGAFLSGGIDSTIIVGLMSQLAGRAGADVLDRLSRRRSSTKRTTPGRRPSGSARSTRSFRSGPTRWRSCPGWCGTTTSRLPTVRPCRRGTFRN